MFFRRAKTWLRTAWRLSAKLLIASSVATVIGFSAVCVSVMFDMRRGEEELARQMLENLAAGIDADIGRNIELYDVAARGRQQSGAAGDRHVSKEIRHLILFDHTATARHFGAIQVFEPRRVDDRRLLARPAAGKPQRRGIFPGTSRQCDFGPVRQPPDAVSRLLCDRAEPAAQRRGWPLSRRRRGIDPVSYFHELFDSLNLAADDTITVLRRDRTIIMRKPFDLDVIGKNIATVRAGTPDNLKAGGSYAGQGRSTRHPGSMCGAPATVHWMSWSENRREAIMRTWQRGSHPHRRDHAGPHRVRARHHAVPRPRDRPPCAGRGQAGRARDHGFADRTEEPPQVRYRDRPRMAARGAAEDAAGADR